MSSFVKMVENITPEIYQNLKQSVELGKWPNGKPLTNEQKETCLQAVIAWERLHLPEAQRTGFMEAAACQSHDEGRAQDENIIIKTQTTH